ncbi:subtilase family protein [Actinokineospora spheciospongiae]|uniref:Subtilase family protein n=1 Tax=Actinokineospora spheciospongiae TaxID=909613 RepID=W7IV22_9PSEU|nr:type VII secretion-associated serine protease mycosin [Actinokineospora spheciospongiae]EWC60577.1 subtilase family protein [Actinokineospora spheciospongiae]
MRALRCALAAGLATVLLAPTASAQQSVPALPATSDACLPAPQGSATDVPWAQKQLAPQRVWPVTRGAGVVVAVVDTGVDSSVPQLSGGRVLPGIDVITPGGGRADSDCYGHGTFLAGIIAARTEAGTGFAGVAPDATILPVRVATSAEKDKPGALTPTGMARGIRAAVDAGARVINVSASTTAPSAELAAAIDHAAAKDVVVVASASNGARDGDPVTYPASYPTVVAVGAVDAAGARADFSQTGPYLSLVAPGVDVVSTGPKGPGHWQGSGTSYAAPFVAGTAALVRAYRPTLTAAQVKHRLEATANHPAAALPDPGLGWGTVNPMAAVTAVLPAEGGAPAGPLVAPPAAQPPVAAPHDELGPVLAGVGVTAVALLVPAMVLASRLMSAGRGRRWRRARVVQVVPSRPAKTG